MAGTSPPAPLWPWTARNASSPRPAAEKKVHLLAAVTHVPGLVIAQDKVAKSGKANEITHFRPLLEPLPLDGVLVTSDAMQANQGQRPLPARKPRSAHYLWPILGNQPNLNAQLNALPWETTPVAAATSEISRGRIETRTIRVLPAPDGTGFQDAAQAVLIERYTTYKKKGQWRTRCRGRPLHHQPGSGRRTPGRPAGPRPRPLAGGAHALATRRDLERRQITHPNRKRSPDLVRPRQPRHHPLPHTRSNQLHRGNPPLRPGPPPRPAIPRPDRPLTRLNTARDFDESLPACRVHAGSHDSSGVLHYAYLQSVNILITWPPSPCGRLSRPPWRGVTPATITRPVSPWGSRPLR